MKKDNWRKIAQEIDLDPAADRGMTNALRAISAQRQTLGAVPMPKNYEDQLISALRRKLPLEKKAETGFWIRLVAMVQVPRISLQWTAAAGTFATIAVIATVVMHRGHIARHLHKHNFPMGESMLFTTAETSDEASVDSWLNSISDSSRGVADRHIASLAEEMQGLDSGAQKAVLNTVLPEKGDI